MTAKIYKTTVVKENRLRANERFFLEVIPAKRVVKASDDNWSMKGMVVPENSNCDLHDGAETESCVIVEVFHCNETGNHVFFNKVNAGGIYKNEKSAIRYMERDLKKHFGEQAKVADMVFEGYAEDFIESLRH